MNRALQRCMECGAAASCRRLVAEAGSDSNIDGGASNDKADAG